LKDSRVGRPRTSKLKPAKLRLTRQVRRLIDVAHDGNVHEASKVSGMAYATLRDLYTGRSTNPNVKTLEILGRKYGVYPGWFTDDTQPEEVPLGGWVSYVSGFDNKTDRGKVRGITIPFSAWPLPAIYERLCAAVEAMPRHPERPIIGATTDDAEISLRVTDFLLAPLLNAEKITGNEMILHDRLDKRHNRQEQEKWILRLRRLGILWEEIFADNLRDLRIKDENR
jgi:hypothetical protein